PRFLRPWRFATSCRNALAAAPAHVSIGFDKTWGQDVLYPQGGLHAASTEHNYRKQRSSLLRGLARTLKWFDLAHWSYSLLERFQYCGQQRPLVVVNSHMVAHHFHRFYNISPDELRVIYSAIDPDRFVEHDRPRRRLEFRQQCGLAPQETVALFVAM